MYEISPKAINIANHIFEARIDNCDTVESRMAWTSARDIFRAIINDDIEGLMQFDYMQTAEEYNHCYGN